MSIKLELTNKELEQLAEIGIMSEWLISAYDMEDKPLKKPYLDLIQKIFKLAADNGNRYINCFEDEGIYEPEPDWENKSLSRKFIDEFEQQAFWVELVRALAEKEAQKEIALKSNLSSDKQFDIFNKHAQKIAKEFETNGIKNLMLKKIKKSG